MEAGACEQLVVVLLVFGVLLLGHLAVLADTRGGRRRRGRRGRR